MSNFPQPKMNSFDVDSAMDCLGDSLKGLKFKHPVPSSSFYSPVALSRFKTARQSPISVRQQQDPGSSEENDSTYEPDNISGESEDLTGDQSNLSLKLIIGILAVLLILRYGKVTNLKVLKPAN